MTCCYSTHKTKYSKYLCCMLTVTLFGWWDYVQSLVSLCTSLLSKWSIISLCSFCNEKREHYYLLKIRSYGPGRLARWPRKFIESVVGKRREKAFTECPWCMGLCQVLSTQALFQRFSIPALWGGTGLWVWTYCERAQILLAVEPQAY